VSLFTTSTFRLAAAYLVIFALSVGAILAYVYWSTVVVLERQTDDTIRAEVLSIADQYGTFGLQGVANVVNRRSQDNDQGIYLLVNPEYNRISGNMQSLPPAAMGPTEQGFVDFPLIAQIDSKPQNHTGRAYYLTLTGNYRVLVGRDVEAQRDFADIIRRALYWALGLALVAGLGGGWLMSRSFLKRIDAITNASRAIMAGDMSQRMPLKGSDDEIDRLSQSLNDMLSQISSLMTGMKDVTTNVAHDLRTPLTRMRTRAEAALRIEDPGEHRAALSHAIEECDQLLATFNALLSIAKSETGQSREGLQEIDAANILRDVVELYEPMAEEQGGHITLHPVAEPLLLRGDRQLLAQALSNVVDNALKYATAEKGVTIELSGQREAEKIVLEVSDHGPGIPEADRTRVLERFVRLDESRSRPGNGLGLALVSAVVKLHNGTLSLRQRLEGQGLVVQIKLPTSL
jgi:signal transduction histidine kinase